MCGSKILGHLCISLTAKKHHLENLSCKKSLKTCMASFIDDPVKKRKITLKNLRIFCEIGKHEKTG